MTLIAMPIFMICKRGSALARRKAPPLRLFKRGGVSDPLKPGKRRLIYSACGILLALLSLAGYGAYLARNLPAEPPRRTLGGLDLTMEERTLLERRILNIHIEAPGEPDRIDLYLDAETVMPVIYDAPVPFEYSGEGRTVRFILGEAPPVPLDLEIVVPLDFSGFLMAEALYGPSGPDTGELRRVTILPLQ
jgi:hypothetical protein